MDTNKPLPPDGFNEQIIKAQENFKIISELKVKLKVLTEHVESRKQALEEEIEENLHEAIRHGKDCLEKIQENINPKLEKVIREKLGEIDKKMTRWKEDNLEAVGNEIKKESPALVKKVLWELDQMVVDKIKIVKDQANKSIREDLQAELKVYKENAAKEFRQLRTLCFCSLGFSFLVLVGGAVLVASR